MVKSGALRKGGGGLGDSVVNNFENIERQFAVESVHVKTRRKTDYFVTFWKFLSFAIR